MNTEEIVCFQMVIPQQHQAVFLLKLHATKPPGFYSESIVIETDYQVRGFYFQMKIWNHFFLIGTSYRC